MMGVRGGSGQAESSVQAFRPQGVVVYPEMGLMAVLTVELRHRPY